MKFVVTLDGKEIGSHATPEAAAAAAVGVVQRDLAFAVRYKGIGEIKTVWGTVVVVRRIPE